MIVASQLRSGLVIRVGGDIFKIISAEYHGGGGKMGGVTHCKMQNLLTGTSWEHRFRAEERLEEVELARRSMDVLYSDADNCYFMDPTTYEQTAISRAMVGAAEKFLQPEMKVQVEFYGDQPVSVLTSSTVEVKVGSTSEPVHQQQDNTFKTAILENGMEVLVPQFVRSGDMIRLEVETGKYVERVQQKEKK